MDMLKSNNTEQKSLEFFERVKKQNVICRVW